jgi:hypothetical protein
MNMMKKFEIPTEMNKNFIPEVFVKKPRVTLDHFKNKKEYVAVRERANTFYESKPRSNYYNIYWCIRIRKERQI